MKIKSLLVLPMVLALSACSLLDKKEDKNTTDAQDIQAIQALNQNTLASVSPASSGFSFDVPSVSNATTNSRSASSSTQFPVSQSTTLNERDRLDVTVFKVPELSATDLTIETNGAISLPLLGSVVVRGLSINQAEQKIAGLLAQNYMQDPKVTVTRKEQALRRVTVEGAVRTPGVFPISGKQMTFLQAIALSQGLTDVANDKTVLVFRNGRQYGVNLDLIRRGKAQDPYLQNDDRIVVLKSDNKVLEEKVINYLPALLSPFSLLR